MTPIKYKEIAEIESILSIPDMIVRISHFGKWAAFQEIANREVNFSAAPKTSGTAAESAPFGGLTRSGVLALARCDSILKCKSRLVYPFPPLLLVVLFELSV